MSDSQIRDLEEKYNLIHRQQIDLSGDVGFCLETIQWYLPNSNSIQSVRDDTLADYALSDSLFSSFCEDTGIKRRCAVNNNKRILKAINNQHPADSRPTIIMLCYDNKSKSTCLFDHLRNAVSHGRFNFFDGKFVCFDHHEQYNFFLRVDANSLKNYLCAIIQFRDRSHLGAGLYFVQFIMKAISKIQGYSTKANVRSDYDFSLFDENANRAFNVDLKILRHNRDLPIILKTLRLNDPAYLMIIINLSNKTRMSSQEIPPDKHIILNKSELVRMQNGNDTLTQKMDGIYQNESKEC